MTIIEHALYGGASVYKFDQKLFWWGMLIGLFPDIPPLLFAMYKVGAKKGLQHFTWKAISEDIPESVYKLYDVTHSFVTVIIVSFILYFVARSLTILVIPWTLHILCDIPFHDSRFSTRFLYPLTNLHIHGYSQRNHRWIHIVNGFVIVSIYIWLLK